jgi:cobalt/nickel transport system ATP-binding protein
MVSDQEITFDVRDVSYAYEHTYMALDRISLSVRKGERVAILGANGSGKSTLLKLMDGLYFPSSGQISYYGDPLTETAFRNDDFQFAFRRQVGFVFQDSEVQLFCPSVWDEIAFAPLQMGLSQSEVSSRVQSAMAALRIEKLSGRAPHHLSGGEKKRVALASVLSLDPDVWLMDEPTAGLDPQSRYWLEEFISQQGNLGKTILFATHDLELVEAVADRVFVFNQEHGLVDHGTPQEILTNTALLTACNLLHEHWHRHPETGLEHNHLHQHTSEHDHTHGELSE